MHAVRSDSLDARWAVDCGDSCTSICTRNTTAVSTGIDVLIMQGV